MKYVRTKDGHLFNVKKDLGRYGCSTAVLICDFHGNVIDLRQQDNILKEADTIEELLDMCFVKRQYNPNYKFGTLYECEYEIEVFKKKLKSNNPITAIYGLIMTFNETGAPTIKSVAKLNDKGDWELL